MKRAGASGGGRSRRGSPATSGDRPGAAPSSLPRGRFRRVRGAGGARLLTFDAGPPAATPIVFSHGFSMSMGIFRKQLQSALARDFRLEAFDLRGHGGSDRTAAGLRHPPTWPDDLDAVLDGLRLERALLCCWSMGSAVVGRYLHCRGDGRLLALHFASGLPGPEVEGPAWGPLRRDFAGPAAASRAAIGPFVRALTHRPLPPAEAAELERLADATPPRIRRALLELPPTPECGSDRPVLVTHGREDRITSAASARRGTSLFPQAVTEILDGVGHGAARSDDALRGAEPVLSGVAGRGPGERGPHGARLADGI